jgi:hypothetical protein
MGCYVATRYEAVLQSSQTTHWGVLFASEAAPKALINVGGILYGTNENGGGQLWNGASIPVGSLARQTRCTGSQIADNFSGDGAAETTGGGPAARP